ncbi:hypothetical protein EES43_21300 [Streptomyces sp. ADI96-02]|uniref:hypothetical protein n=1 Tax=unclassified Streptomyces TaxID=2593676 RepID=UPI000F555442|nr:hypothetical protein [Streptomyces sp. ADI96-02]RPK57700.1 hypothetical protein EES43_21300 [Streptomyces sp. ADI96-02]
MTSRAGEPFAAARAAAEVGELLAAPVPEAGPTRAEGDPVTGEWSATAGAGFRIVPLWEGDALSGVYGGEWTDAEEAGEARLAALSEALDAGWGPHRTVRTHVPLLRWQAGNRVEPLFAALFAEDLYGDLLVWGPVGPPDRWFAVGVGHSDGDAPLVLAALVSARPVDEPDPADGP